MRSYRHLVCQQEARTITLVPHKIIPEPVRVRIDKFHAELGRAEHQHRCMVVLAEALDLNPELCEVNGNVPRATLGLKFCLLGILIGIC